jgi:hypothetical protein
VNGNLSHHQTLQEIQSLITKATYYNGIVGLFVTLITSGNFFRIIGYLFPAFGLLFLFGNISAIVLLFIGLSLPRIVYNRLPAFFASPPTSTSGKSIRPQTGTTLLFLAGLFTLWAVLGSLFLWKASIKTYALQHVTD